MRIKEVTKVVRHECKLVVRGVETFQLGLLLLMLFVMSLAELDRCVGKVCACVRV